MFGSLKSLDISISKHVRRNALAYFAIYALLCFFAGGFCFDAVLLRSVGSLGSRNLVVALISAFLVFLSFLALLKLLPGKPEYIFLSISIPVVIAFGLLIIPGNVPDEEAHIWQVVALFYRNPQGFDIPKCLLPELIPRSYDALYTLLNLPGSWDISAPVPRTLSSYWSHLYFIPGVICGIGRFFNCNVYLTLIIARLFNGIFYICCAYFLLKLIPVGKTAFLIFLLNPMLIQQQASCSCDSVVNLVTLSFFVILLHSLAQEKINKRELVVLFLFFLLSAISKYIYAFMGYLFLLFVPRLKDKRKRILIYSGTVIFSFAIAAFIVALYHGSFMPDAFDLLRNPVLFASVLFKSIWKLAYFYISSYAGHQLGQLNIIIWEPCLWIYLIIQFSALYYNSDDEGNLSFERIQFVIMIADAFLVFILALLSMRSWSINADHNYDFITGVQGRYLIPVMFQSLLVFHVPNRAYGNKFIYLYSFLLVFIYLFSCFGIFNFF